MSVGSWIDGVISGAKNIAIATGHALKRDVWDKPILSGHQEYAVVRGDHVEARARSTQMNNLNERMNGFEHAYGDIIGTLGGIVGGVGGEAVNIADLVSSPLRHNAQMAARGGHHKHTA